MRFYKLVKTVTNKSRNCGREVYLEKNAKKIKYVVMFHHPNSGNNHKIATKNI
jgi:hypothetical protein